jgi:hypothetical protein
MKEEEEAIATGVATMIHHINLTNDQSIDEVPYEF